MKTIGRDAYFAVLDAAVRPYHAQYRAMYASDLGGIVTDPLLMRIPLDDHMVHRGDGAFEMCKCLQRGVYNLEAHLRRLSTSTASLGLALPVPLDAVRDIVLETLLASGLDDAAIRIYVSRGPGSFGVSPADCPEAGLYVVVSTLQPGFMEQHPAGARVGISQVPLKPGIFATMKHCNYLQNVMMKREALARGLDFTIGMDHEGFLAEGPTENIGLITDGGDLIFPQPDRVLEGTTMVRVLALAGKLVAAGTLSSAGYGRVGLPDVERAAALIITGTTTDVTHVCRFEKRTWSSMVESVQLLRDALLADILHNPEIRVSLD